MASCLFPTGFLSVFHGLFVLGTIFLFLSNKFPKLKSGNAENFFFAFFLWLLGTELLKPGMFDYLISFRALFEYRYILITAMVMFVFKSDQRLLKIGIWGLLIGTVINVVGSYLLAMGVISWRGAEYSFSNHIFHGFAVSVAAIGLYTLSIKSKNFSHQVAYFSFATFALIHVMFIEDGRTGFILATLVSGCFLLFSLVFLKRSRLILLILFLAVCFFFLTNREVIGLFEDLEIFLNGDYKQIANKSNLARIDFFITPLSSFKGSTLFGFGLSEVPIFYANLFQQNILLSLTDNPHSEIINVFFASGLGGVSLMYLAFLYPLFRVMTFGIKSNRNELIFLGFTLMLFFIVSSFGNAILKDYGEKNLLLIIYTLVGQINWSRKENWNQKFEN